MRPLRGAKRRIRRRLTESDKSLQPLLRESAPVANLSRIETVFLNIPYDDDFEDLYLAYVVGLTQLGLKPVLTLAVPNQGRLETIIELIESSDCSIHDLSRIELSGGIPRFNMPLELGLALYRRHVTRGRHRVYIFERRAFRTQKSTSDVNGIDPKIHLGKPSQLMARLRDVFRQAGDFTTVPEMLASFRAVKRKLPQIRENAGGGSLFEAAALADIVLAALIEYRNRSSSPRHP